MGIHNFTEQLQNTGIHSITELLQNTGIHSITELLQNTGIHSITVIKNHNSNTPPNLKHFWHEARQTYINLRHLHHHRLAYIAYFLHNATVSSWITPKELKSMFGLHSLLNPTKHSKCTCQLPFTVKHSMFCQTNTFMSTVGISKWTAIPSVM